MCIQIYRDSLTEEQGTALQLNNSAFIFSPIHGWCPLFLHATSEKKRNDTFSSFTTGSDLHFGRIGVFLASPMKYMLIRVCDFKDKSFTMQKSGFTAWNILCIL